MFVGTTHISRRCCVRSSKLHLQPRYRVGHASVPVIVLVAHPDSHPLAFAVREDLHRLRGRWHGSITNMQV